MSVYTLIRSPSRARKTGTIGDIHEEFDPTGKIAVLHVMLEKIRNKLKTLEPRQQRVLMVHFGLNFMECKTISETAAYYHLAEINASAAFFYLYNGLFF